MKLRFEDKNLEKADRNPSKQAGVDQTVDKRFRDRMALIRSAPDERDFYKLKSLRYEKLKGKRKDERSMRLNDQWRLILKIEGEGKDTTVVVAGITDYH